MIEKEYDFSKAEQGKFHRKVEDLDIPIYLDNKVKQFFNKKALEKNIELDEVVNAVLLKEMELASAAKPA